MRNFLHAPTYFVGYLANQYFRMQIRNRIRIEFVFNGRLDSDPDPHSEYRTGSRRGKKSKNEGEDKQILVLIEI
jgi:hypothetical protein